MFMAGGPSQLELFDYKPVLAKLDGKPIPESYIKGKRFAFMDSSHRITLLAGKRPFKQHGKCGAWVSDLMPYTAKIVDRAHASSRPARPTSSITRRPSSS